MKINNKIAPQQFKTVVFKRNALTNSFYILAIILLWISAYIFLYDTSLYYLYQWFGSFAVSLNFILLLSLILPILAVCSLFEKILQRREMIIQINHEMMTITQAEQTQQFKWDDIEYVILFKNNMGIRHLNIATIFPKVQHTFYLQSLFTIKKTEQPQLELLWKSLKKTPPIGLNVNYHCENHAKTLIEILTLQRADCAHNQYLAKLNKRKYHLLIASFIVLSIVAGLLCWYVWHSQKLSLNHNEQNIEGTNFRSFEQQIYIWKQGQGLFVLPGVKDNDFEGLSLDHLENRAPELYSNVGKTSSTVYWQEHPLLLNSEQSEYLGNDYTKDQQQVYFRNILLPKASAGSFKAVLHPEFNTLGYFYGKDQQQVYYKNKPLSPLQPGLSQAFSNSFDYIRDYHNVYYHDQRLDKLNAGFTEIFPANNRFSQGLNLAWDRRGYFYLNENELPNISHGKYFGTDPVDLTELRIVATQSDEPYPGQYHWIFADLHRVYVYDEFYQRLVTLYDFSPQRIQVTGEMTLAVHDKTYQLQSTLLRSRSRHGSTSHGFQLSLINTQTQKTIAGYFSRIASSFSPQKTLSQWIHPDSDEE